MRETFETAAVCLGFAAIMGGFVSTVGFVTERVLAPVIGHAAANAGMLELVVRAFA